MTAYEKRLAWLLLIIILITPMIADWIAPLPKGVMP